MAELPWTTLLDDRFRRDKELRKIAGRLCKLETKLKRVMSDEAWGAYLKLEELGTLRLCRMVAIAAEEGTGCARRRRGD